MLRYPPTLILSVPNAEGRSIVHRLSSIVFFLAYPSTINPFALSPPPGLLCRSRGRRPRADSHRPRPGAPRRPGPSPHEGRTGRGYSYTALRQRTAASGTAQSGAPVRPAPAPLRIVIVGRRLPAPAGAPDSVPGPDGLRLRPLCALARQ